MSAAWVFWVVWTSVAYMIVVTIRSHFVFQERHSILLDISERTREDITFGRYDNLFWRYEAFENGPSYARMVLEIWKPIRSYRRQLGGIDA